MKNAKFWTNKYILLIVVIIFLLAGCNNKPSDSIDINLNDLQEVSNNQKSDAEKKELKVAISSITSPKETIIYYNDLLKYLEQNIEMPIKIIQRKTYKEVNNLIESGEVDLAFICTYAYILGHKDFGLKPFIVPQVNGKVTYQSYLIVSTDSNIYKLEDLEGKKFAFTDPLSNTGYIYPLYLLHQKKDKPEDFFKDYTFTYSHDNSIKAVREKVVDGGAVDGLVFDYSAEKQQNLLEEIRIIKKSPEFGIPPIVVSSSIDKQLQGKIMDTLLSMHLTPKGKKILEYIKIDKFLIQNDSNYDSVRVMAGEVLGEK